MSDASQPARPDVQANGKDPDWRVEKILNSIAEGFFTLDEKLVVTFFNKAAGELLGRDPQDVIGKHFFEQAFPEAKDTVFEQKYRHALRTRKTLHFEAYLGAQPYENWYDVRVAPYEDGISVLFQVTTEYHRAIEAERAGQARFRELFDNMAAGVAVYEASPDGRSFFFRDINPAGERITGLTKPEMLGKNVVQAFPGVVEMGVLELLRRVWRTGRAEALPVSMYRDERVEPLWLENYVFKTATGEVVAIFKDYTAEMRALEQARNLARFPDENPDPVMRVDEQGVLTYANNASKPVLGFWNINVGQSVPADIWHAWRQVIATGHPGHVETVCGDKTYSMKVTPMAGMPYTNVYGRDITDIRAAAEEHERVQEELQHAQKMESVGRLAGGVAHDLNNLLTPILGYSQLALKGLAEDAPLYHDIEQIQQAGQRAQSLTRQLLAFGRKQMLELSVLNLSEEVRKAEPILRRVIRENVEIELHLAEDLGNVRADAVQINQILMNLAMNAQDAMPDGGRLDIETADATFDETHARTHPNVQPGPYVLLAVSDTGVGIDESAREKIFEPFFTTKPPGKGTGLGLATVYGIVLQHKGGIWFYSEPNHGTTFKIYLPRVAAATEPQQTPAPPPVRHAGETVMIVEDEAIVRDLIREILCRNGYKVLTAASGEEAVELAGRTGENIHLLVTDVVLPKMNGRELFERLSESRPDLAVLYMSGYTDNVIAHHGILDEGTSFIEKPFSIHGLTDKVREILDEES